MTNRWRAKARLFIALAVLAVLLLILRHNSLSLPNIIQDTFTLSLGVLYEALPFVFLGILLSTIVQLYVPNTALLKFLPKRPLTRRAVLSVSGSVMPVCECGNVPLARGLMLKGLSPQDALTFVLAAPIINPVTALTTWQAFPGNHNIMLIRLVAAFGIANLVGWLFDQNSKEKLVTEAFSAQCENHSTKHRLHSHNKRYENYIFNFRTFSNRFQHELTSLLPALIGGSVLAGLIQTIIPRSILLGVASQPVLAILTMIALAFIVSICANVDAFFALSLSGIFPASALIAFLVFGPMIDIKILSLLRTTYTAKTLLNTTVVVALSSFFIGLAVYYAV